MCQSAACPGRRPGVGAGASAGSSVGASAGGSSPGSTDTPVAGSPGGWTPSSEAMIVMDVDLDQ